MARTKWLSPTASVNGWTSTSSYDELFSRGSNGLVDLSVDRCVADGPSADSTDSEKSFVLLVGSLRRLVFCQQARLQLFNAKSVTRKSRLANKVISFMVRSMLYQPPWRSGRDLNQRPHCLRMHLRGSGPSCSQNRVLVSQQGSTVGFGRHKKEMFVRCSREQKTPPAISDFTATGDKRRQKQNIEPCRAMILPFCSTSKKQSLTHTVPQDTRALRHQPRRRNHCN